ncbi:MAG: DegV family protein [Clostridia bacterium]|nr:DegV family protein [Clostridia bacterium]
MADYIISGCSIADLSEQHFKDRNIEYVCFHYELDGVPHLDDLGKTMPIADFYAAMQNGADTKTSQVSAGEFVEYFTPFLEAGKDIIHVCISSGISGTVNAANVAKDDLAQKYPDRKIYIVDSLTASSGVGLILDKMADLRDEGYTVDQLYEWVEENKLKAHAWFFTTDLTFFVKGGRVSKVSGWAGTILKICPLLNVDVNGKLIPREKIRTKAKVINAIVGKMLTLADNRAEYNDTCYLSHSARLEDAEAVAKLVNEKIPGTQGKTVINNIGTTIGSHTGPGTVALFFWGDKRED